MPQSVLEAHEELTHYTSATGLSGILSSQCIWATHSSFLNDASEIRLFFDRRLPALMEAEVRLAFQELERTKEGAQAIADFGGLDRAVQDHASHLTNSIREATVRFNEPYIVSFCASTDQRVRENGLLSQWRGYGADGGYAIVFDTASIESLLTAEASKFDYMHMQWGDVHYYDEALTGSAVAEEIRDAETTLRSGVAAYIRDPKEDSFEPVYEAVTTLSCLLKHWGFHEEREVRIVAIPTNSSVRAATPEPRKPSKAPSTFIRNGCAVPYIRLFEHMAPNDENRAGHLPIKRVIIGPHRDSAQRKLAVEVLLRSLGIVAQVHISEIPYVGR